MRIRSKKGEKKRHHYNLNLSTTKEEREAIERNCEYIYKKYKLSRAEVVRHILLNYIHSDDFLFQIGLISFNDRYNFMRS